MKHWPLNWAVPSVSALSVPIKLFALLTCSQSKSEHLSTLHLLEFNVYIVRLGCAPQNQQPSWVEGYVRRYSDWMPDQPNIRTAERACVEMFTSGKNPISSDHNNFKLWNYSKELKIHIWVANYKSVSLPFFTDEGWWTANTCDLRRASICSYPIATWKPEEAVSFVTRIFLNVANASVFYFRVQKREKKCDFLLHTW